MSQENSNKSGENEGGGDSQTEVLVSDHDQILAHFHELTHLDDFEQCQAILESTNWNLDQAIQSYFNGDGLISSNDDDAVVINHHVPGEDLSVIGSSVQSNQINSGLSQGLFSRLRMPEQSLFEQATTGIIDHSRDEVISNNSKRLLNFHIEYQDKKFTLHIPDSECVSKIKELVKEELNIPVENLKLNGWRNKSLFINDNMMLNQLNLPLDTNLFVINTSEANLSGKSTHDFGGMVLTPSTKSSTQDVAGFSGALDDYILDIKLINTNKQQMTIINNSTTFDSSTLVTKNISITNSNSSIIDTFFHLNFQSSVKFIEIRRKIALLTGIYANNQEWYYYLVKNEPPETSYDDILSSLKTYNDVSAFHRLLEANKLFAIPLTTIIEDNQTLFQMKKMLEDLNDEASSNVSTATSSSSPNQNNSKYKNSKLTPPILSKSTKTTSPSIQMIFIVTVKNANYTNNVNNLGYVSTSIDAKASSGSLSHHQFSIPNASSNNFIPLGFENLMSLEEDSSMVLGTTPSSSMMPLNPKKPKTNDAEIETDFSKTNNDINNESSDTTKNSHLNYDESLDNDDEMHNLADDDDLDDHFLLDTKEKKKPLISKECPVGNELVCTNAFVEEFNKRYGPMIPLFFIGSLEEAIKEALLCPAKDRKLLSIYLHSDQTVFCNIFCAKTMCDENVINFTSSNFVIWPWDITVKEHENYFYETCSKHLGSVFVSNLKNLKDKFPLFLIVTRVRSTNEVVAIIEGDCTNENLMHRLMQTYEMFESQRIKDERDEITRDEREKIKREQDAAYQTSLEADKAKRQRQDEENEKLKQAAQLELELERHRQNERENKIKQAATNLPNEPTGNTTDPITNIRFRLPSGEFLQRRFFIKDKLEALLDFATSHGYFADDYKLLTSWPRKDLTNETKTLTIEQLKLFPQETLTLEQR